MTKTGKLLCELIARPSVNPAFLPPRDPRGGEQQVARFLADRAARERLEVEFQPVLPQRNNLVIRLAPTVKRQHRILLAPHLDTVGGDEHRDQLFTPRVRNNRIYGRGACDTKGSVAAMFDALCRIASSPKRPAHTEIVFIGLVDEECAQAGSRALATSRLKADFAIVGEPTRLHVVTAHKGALWLQLQTHGKEAHGARPELGRNAVYTMARVIEALHVDYARLLQRRRHTLLGTPTLNIGCIRGGRQPNIVPGDCVISLDRRTLPGERDAQVMRELKDFLHQRGLNVTLKRERPEPCLPLETDPELTWVRQMLRSVRKKVCAGVDYFSDAGVLANGGIPSVVFGPGDIAQAHTANEWIALDQLERGRDMLIRFLQSLP